MNVAALVYEFLGAVVFGTWMGFAVGLGIVAYVWWDEWRAFRARRRKAGAP